MSSASKRRQKSNEEEAGGANWMDTYGDLVTLLLCFFVLLYAFSSVDVQKWEALVGALSGSKSVVIPVLNPEMAMEQPIELIQTTLVQDQQDALEGSQARIDFENFLKLRQNIEEYVTIHDLEVSLDVDLDYYRVIIRFNENVLFESGKADLLPEALPVLDHVITLLSKNQELISVIRIEGHTDNVPINTTEFEDNWDLSSKRSTTSIRYILDSGEIDRTKINVSAYGEERPVDSNETPQGREKNRRVDFVVEAYRNT